LHTLTTTTTTTTTTTNQLSSTRCFTKSTRTRRERRWRRRTDGRKRGRLQSVIGGDDGRSRSRSTCRSSTGDQDRRSACRSSDRETGDVPEPALEKRRQRCRARSVVLVETLKPRGGRFAAAWKSAERAALQRFRPDRYDDGAARRYHRYILYGHARRRPSSRHISSVERAREDRESPAVRLGSRGHALQVAKRTPLAGTVRALFPRSASPSSRQTSSSFFVGWNVGSFCSNAVSSTSAKRHA